MCSTVVTRDGVARSCGELAALLGIAVEDLPAEDDAAPGATVSDCCLCSVDLAAAADQAGLVAFRPAYDDGDPMEWGMVPEADVRALLTGKPA